MKEKFVFHGSPRPLDASEAIPRRNIREQEGVIVFDEESFHATPHKWIALAYTYHPESLPKLDEEYSMAVNLYSEEKEVIIFGVGSLEESLRVLYQNGGYLYHFDEGNFIYKEGLGSQEVIATEPTTPLHMERVADPVAEMKKLGVVFTFIDLAEGKD